MSTMAENHVVRETIAASAAAIGDLARQADAIERIAAAAVDALQRGNKILTAGNGGSAAQALHMAEELVGRFRGNRRSLPALSLAADPTALTCIGNDYGFDEIFRRQVEGLGQAGDVLVLFSTSGRAPNLAAALDAAAARGLTTVGLLGRDGGALAGRVDLELVVPGQATERIQEAHLVVLHIVLDAVERAFPAESR